MTSPKSVFKNGHKYGQKYGKIVAATLCSMLFSACVNPLGSQASLTPPQGNYTGYYYVSTNGGATTPTYVTGSLTTAAAPNVISSTFASSPTNSSTPKVSFSVDVTSSNGTDIVVAFPGLITATMKATWNQDAICFLGDSGFKDQSGNEEENRLCYNGAPDENEFAIDFYPDATDEYVIVVDQVNGNTTPASPPQTYSYDQVLTTASTQDFQSQVQYENTQLSKDSDTEAKMALIPGDLSLTSILSIVTQGLSWNSVLDAIGTFVPFLLPSRWIALDEANQQLKADQLAYTIMQENSANTAEGLVWGLLQDEQALVTLQPYQSKLQGIYTYMEDQVENGQEPPGSDIQIELVIQSLTETVTTLCQAVDDDQRAIAQAMGLMNPEAVTDVVPPTLPPLVLPDIPNINNGQVLEEQAWQQSLEHQQAVALIDVAGDQYKNRFFYWLDPSGAGAGVGIGAGLPASIAAGKENIVEMETDEGQLNQTMNTNIANTVDQLKSAITNYNLQSTSLAEEQELITIYTDEFENSQTADPTALQGALEGALQDEVTKNTAAYQFYIALGNLNRLLLLGPYATIATPPTPAPSASPSPAPTTAAPQPPLVSPYTSIVSSMCGSS